MVLVMSLSQAFLFILWRRSCLDTVLSFKAPYISLRDKQKLYAVWQHQEVVKCTSTITKISSGVLTYSKCPSAMLIQHDK